MREKEKKEKKRIIRKIQNIKNSFLAEITDKSLTFSNRAQSRILWS